MMEQSQKSKSIIERTIRRVHDNAGNQALPKLQQFKKVGDVEPGNV
ncbi:MAG: hypothetical protein RSB86_10465 [Comamonas sp.]